MKAETTFEVFRPSCTFNGEPGMAHYRRTRCCLVHRFRTDNRLVDGTDRAHRYGDDAESLADDLAHCMRPLAAEVLRKRAAHQAKLAEAMAFNLERHDANQLKFRAVLGKGGSKR